ncbi:MAG: hypothetical protein ACRDCN_14445 [Tannerellaceae bacterium]
MCACTDIVYYDDSSQMGELSNGKLRLAVDMQFSKSDLVHTKAGGESAPVLKNAYLLIFESTDAKNLKETDRLLQIVKVETGSIVPFSVVVNPVKVDCRIKVIVNLDEAAETTVAGYTCLGGSASIAPTTIGDFKQLIVPMSSLYANDVANEYLPFANAQDLLVEGVNPQTNLTIKLARVYAEINLSVDSSVSLFTLESVQLRNGYEQGRFCLYQEGEWGVTTPTDKVVYKPIVAANNRIAPFYLFENLGSTQLVADQTIMLVKGSYKGISGYYMLYVEYAIIENGATSYHYNICRNNRYIITIKSVKNYGYPTIEEALKSSPQNDALEYDVMIDDEGKSNDILYHSSGYSIGATNSEVWVYAESATSEYIATTITFDVTDLPPGSNFKPSRSIQCSSPDMIVINSAEVITKEKGMPVDLKIKVQKPGVKGVITIQYGGLRKEIQVSSFKMLKSDSQQAIKIENAMGAKYEDLSMNPWLRVSRTVDYPQGYAPTTSFDRPTTVYCVAMSHKENTPRQSTPLYFYRNSEVGTLKVIAVQTYGATWENDVYYRESAAKSAVQKRANTILIPNKEVRNYRITGTRLYDYYKQEMSNLTAEVCWADFNLFDPNPFEPHQLIEVQNIDGGYQDVRLRVRKYVSSCQNGGNGNVVWGLKSAEGKWVWTWHIWLSDLVAESDNQILYSNSTLPVFASASEYKTTFGATTGIGIRFPKLVADGGINKTFLDRNMGAKVSSYLSTGNIYSSEGLKHYGLYYQWGRKDPLPGSAYLSQPGGTNPKDIEIFTAKSNVGILYGSAQDHKTKSQITMIQSINMPLLLAHADYKDWCTDVKVNRWNETSTPMSKGKKTIYDPSPYGWRLNWGAGNELANTATKTWKVYADLTGMRPGGVLVDNKYWFPASGSRDYFTGYYNWIGMAGAFWTGGYTWDSHGALSYFELKGDQCYYNKDFHIARTYACTLRPILDER